VIFLLQIFQGSFKFQFKNLIGGIVLGIANYFSIYFLVKAIGYKGLESSTFFIVNNVGVLFVTSLLGAVVGIILVSLSGSF